MHSAAASGFEALRWSLAPLMFGIAAWTAAALVSRVPRISAELVATEAGRLHAIDGLRGLLAIGVMAHHTAITWFYLGDGVWKAPPSRLLVHLGQSSVALFFMITAFLFWGRVIDRGTRMDWGAFAVSRVFRLYPAYLVTLVLVVIVTAASALRDGTFAWQGHAAPLASWLLFTAAGTPPLNGFPETNLLTAGVLWSLRYEWLFYCALPVLAWIVGRSGNAPAALAAAGGLVVTAWLFDWVAAADPWIALSFAGGIVAARWVRRPDLLAASRSPWASTLALLALAATVAWCPTAYEPAATAGLTVFFIPVAAGNAFHGVLHHRALLWLGEISYAIYLLHGLCLWLILRVLLPRVAMPLNPWVFLPAAGIVAVLAVLLASAVFLFVEKPGIRAGRLVYEGWQAAGRRRPGAVPVKARRP